MTKIEHGRESCPVCTPHQSWRLTRRGRIVRNIAMTLVLLTALTLLALAWESGQAKQCGWYRQHGTKADIRSYCSGGR